jgi:hypothetical protein
MNPEFQRNLWLELTPRRMGLMLAFLVLAFAAAALSDSHGPASAARWLYYLIVVVWGTRNAAMSVVGEIRERTWDLQLLTSIRPGAMMWGKLFGATIYNWFGGAICLVVMLVDTLGQHGVAATVAGLVYYIAVGVIAQAAAFLASLIAVRRRQAHSRLDILIYQAVGLAAGAAVLGVWTAADPAGSVLLHKPASDFVIWWGQRLDTRLFLLASLAVFAAWTLTGCYREMRLELKMRNGPLVWLGFLLFIGLYVAGFDAWLTNDNAAVQGFDPVSLRLALAVTTYVVLTYAMVVLEPKDRVQLRWLGQQISSGRLISAWNGLQAWMMSYGALVLTSVALLVWVHRIRPDAVDHLALIAAGLGFVTRDISIVVLMRSLPGRRRGDLAALSILFALYVLAPAIVNGLGMPGLLMILYPKLTAPVWLGPAVAWAEAITVALFAFSRVALAGPRTASA